jgi:hypothetical protein
MDICRQSIVFECVPDLLRCLRAVRHDPEVRIMRIKNRLDPDYDGRLSAGASSQLKIRLEFTRSHPPQAAIVMKQAYQLTLVCFTRPILSWV